MEVFNLRTGEVVELFLYARGILVASIRRGDREYIVWRGSLKEATTTSQKEAMELAVVGARKAFSKSSPAWGEG